MDKEKNASVNYPHPILEICEFEEQASSVLGLAKKETSQIIREAKKAAEAIILQEKIKFPLLDDEYTQKLNVQINSEKERILKKSKEEIARIEAVSSESIQKAVGFLLEKLIEGSESS